MKPTNYLWDVPDDAFEAPDFWIGAIDDCHAFVESLPGISVSEIGRSAGDRPIIAAAYGEFKPLERSSVSLSSSQAGLGGRKQHDMEQAFPESFFGTSKREKPTVVFEGNMHGSEIAGTVAAMNLLNLLVHGTDVRGREWPRLRDAASGMRIVVIPHANPDGRARWEPAKHLTTATHEQSQRVTQGWLADGTLLSWPSCKRLFPIPTGGVLGAYYNDNGANLNHDLFLGAHRQPETDAVLSYLLDEMPDAVIVGHTDQGTLISAAPPYIPEPYATLYARFAGAVAAAIRDKNLPIFSYPSFANRGGGIPPFTQVDAIYHQCGALPLMVEFPNSTDGHALSFDTILDVGLTVLEAIIVFGAEFGFRPCLRKHLADGRVMRRYGKLTEE